MGIVIINALKRDARSRPASKSFRYSAVFFARTHCSICQTNHDRFAKEGWVYEPSVDRGVWPRLHNVTSRR